MTQRPTDSAWRLGRLHSLTNFGYITVDSPVLDVEMDTWYFLPPESLGHLRIPQPISIWLDSHVAHDLDVLTTKTLVALRGFAQLRMSALSYRASPASIQGWSPVLPIQTDGNRAELPDYVEQHGLTGQMTSGFLLDFDVHVTCHSSRTHALGDYWLPGLRIAMRPESWVLANPPGRTSDADPGVTWIAECSSACASLFRRDNEQELAQARRYWHALQANDPDIEVAPGEDRDDQMMITEAHPASVGQTNAELWSVNYPRLKTVISRWERELSSTFEWDLSS